MKHKIFQTGFIFMALWLLNCASYTYWDAKSLMKQRRYRAAIDKFGEAEREAPADYRVKRELGIVYYEVKNYAQAIIKLRKAKRLKPDDGLTILYLGLSYEATNLLNEALAEYSQVSRINKFSSARRQIQDRIKLIMNQKISADIRQAIEQEQELNVADVPENTIAVLYFKNINLWKKLHPLEKGLAVMLTTDLSKVRRLKIIERMKLQQLIKELNLSQSELFDVQSAPRLGKLLGAQKLVKGGFITSDEGYFQIIAAVVESQTAELVSIEAQADGRLNDFFKIEKKLVFRLVKAMGIKLSYAEIEEIKKVPTENFMAFLAYAEGLDYEDNGDPVRADNAYQRALGLDPNFQLAKEKIQAVDAAPVSTDKLVRIIAQLENKTPIDRLEISADKVSSSFLPVENDARAVVRPSIGTIIIKGTLPQIDAAASKRP